MVFGVVQLHYDCDISLAQTLVAMVTNIWKFEYKVSVIGLHDSPQPTTIKQQI